MAPPVPCSPASTVRLCRLLLVLTLVALFIGTLMPGGWKTAASRPFSAVVDVAVLSHVALFAVLAFVAPLARLWHPKPWHVPLLGLALALLTEGLQFFAIDRHPNLAGIAQDLAGTFMGWALSQAWQFHAKARS